MKKILTQIALISAIYTMHPLKAADNNNFSVYDFLDTLANKEEFKDAEYYTGQLQESLEANNFNDIKKIFSEDLIKPYYKDIAKWTLNTLNTNIKKGNVATINNILLNVPMQLLLSHFKEMYDTENPIIVTINSTLPTKTKIIILSALAPYFPLDTMISQDLNSRYPIHYAVIKNNIELVKWIIQNGGFSTVTMPDIKLKNPLFFSKNNEITKYLTKMEDFKFFIDTIARGENFDEKIVQALLDDPVAKHLFFEELKKIVSSALKEPSTKKINTLITKKLWNYFKPSLKSLILKNLEDNIAKGNTFDVEQILNLNTLYDIKSFINGFYDYGNIFVTYNILAYTIELPLDEKIKEKMIILLIKGGADPNLKGKNNNTPLHLAAQKNNLGLIKTLIQNGALKSSKIGNFNYKLPLDLATSEEAKKLLKSAAEHYQFILNWLEGGQMSSLYDLPNGLSKSTVENTIKNYNTDILKKLSYAIENEDLNTVSTLLHYNNISKMDGMENILPITLKRKTLKNKVDIVSQLLKYQIYEKDFKNPQGRTLLHIAAKTNDINILKLFVSYGLIRDINAIDKKKNTPRDRASNDEVKKYLDRIKILNDGLNELEKDDIPDFSKLKPFYPEEENIIRKAYFKEINHAAQNYNFEKEKKYLFYFENLISKPSIELKNYHMLKVLLFENVVKSSSGKLEDLNSYKELLRNLLGTTDIKLLKKAYPDIVTFIREKTKSKAFADETLKLLKLYGMSIPEFKN